MRQKIVWWLLTWSCRWWATNGMDQFETFKFNTPYGEVFVGIHRETPYPDAFDSIDKAPAVRRAVS